MQKTTSGMRKWLSVRIAPVRSVSRIVLVRGSTFDLGHHKDATPLVSRSDQKRGARRSDPAFAERKRRAIEGSGTISGNSYL
jgi:hypothetical protein